MGFIFDKLTEGGWNVAVRRRQEGLILEDQKTPFTLILNTRRTWEADPFLWEDDSGVYVFAELYDYIKRRAGIGYSRLENGKWTSWKTVIEEPFHMSYPNVFRLGNDIVMVPETSYGHSLRLYRAVSFPDRWELVKVLADDVMWVDTTFWSEGDRWFGITRDISDWDHQKDMLLELDEQFDLLAVTPIRENSTARSRQGGNFFSARSTRFRVTQDCTKHYGGALTISAFNQDTLTENGMAPITLDLTPADLRFSQNRRWTGLHTYNISEHYEVVDVERRHFHLMGFFVRLLAKLKHL